MIFMGLKKSTIKKAKAKMVKTWVLYGIVIREDKDMPSITPNISQGYQKVQIWCPKARKSCFAFLRMFIMVFLIMSIIFLIVVWFLWTHTNIITTKLRKQISKLVNQIPPFRVTHHITQRIICSLKVFFFAAKQPAVIIDIHQ